MVCVAAFVHDPASDLLPPATAGSIDCSICGVSLMIHVVSPFLFPFSDCMIHSTCNIWWSSFEMIKFMWSCSTSSVVIQKDQKLSGIKVRFDESERDRVCDVFVDICGIIVMVVVLLAPLVELSACGGS